MYLAKANSRYSMSLGLLSPLPVIHYTAKEQSILLFPKSRTYSNLLWVSPVWMSDIQNITESPAHFCLAFCLTVKVELSGRWSFGVWHSSFTLALSTKVIAVTNTVDLR